MTVTCLSHASHMQDQVHGYPGNGVPGHCCTVGPLPVDSRQLCHSSQLSSGVSCQGDCSDRHSSGDERRTVLHSFLPHNEGWYSRWMAVTTDEGSHGGLFSTTSFEGLPTCVLLFVYTQYTIFALKKPSTLIFISF